MVIPSDITTEELMEIDYRYSFTADELASDWQRLVSCTEFKTGSQFAPGIKLCKHFCDEIWSVEDARGMSFELAWNDYEIMDKVREWGLRSMSKLWLSWVRRAVYMVSGLPNTSFYRPHFAKQLISMSGIESGVLFDPCAGWGGRMLGTLAGGWEYIGVDPNKDAIDDLRLILSTIGRDANLSLSAVEDTEIPERADIVLTSPPFYDLERYSDDQTQSYNRFASYDKWESEWLVPLIKRCLSILPPWGLSAWNVMNYRGHDLVGAVVSAHNDCGFGLVGTLGFNSPLANIRNLRNKDVTYIFGSLA